MLKGTDSIQKQVKPKLRKLSNKQKGFIKDVLSGETGTQAALNNYDTTDKDVAGVIASQNLGKLNIQNALEEAMPDELLHQVHREGLFATKQIVRENSETKGFEVVAEEADFSVRHKYLDTAYKLKGSYAPEKLQSVHVQINLDDKEHIEAVTKEINQKLLDEELRNS